MSLRRNPLMRRGRPLAGLLLGIAACAGIGCQTALTVPPETALDKLLRPVATSPDSVTLEIWEARVPLDQDRVAEGLWQEIDEQQLDAELRGRLLANGLRAGVLSGSLPDELADLLGLTGDPPAVDSGDSLERVITADSAQPAVTRSVIQVNRQAPRAIPMSATQDEAIVLINDGGSVGGETFKLVDGRYEVRAQSAPGQRVNVRLTPELHHGKMQNRYTGAPEQGIFLLAATRDLRTFEDLALSVELGAGDSLVVGCLPQSSSTLGGLLHTAAVQGRRERKFLLVRVLESPPSEILAGK